MEVFHQVELLRNLDLLDPGKEHSCTKKKKKKVEGYMHVTENQHITQPQMINLETATDQGTKNKVMQNVLP